MAPSLLGRLSRRMFLRDYWHKKPLLVRGAAPGFQGLIDRRGLLEAACREDVQSRLVLRRGRRWQVRSGPFRRRELAALPPRNWTLLVQELNHLLPAADRLMRAFSFVPLARLDDVMVSLAPVGGGVGPHFDSYDVFLLQGSGRRSWRVSAQRDLELEPDAPLRILRNFVPEQEWILEPGDMLYLPPGYAHDGVAVDECTTYSIGFRAPTAQEIAQAFLDHLHDTLALPGRYADPDLALQRHPAAIDARMTAQIAAMLRGIRWTQREVARFLGADLTEPKPHVFFSPPQSPLSRARFLAGAARAGVVLALKSRMLFDRGHVYLNGETFRPGRAAASVLRAFANSGLVPPGSILGAEVADLLYEWYRAGYVELPRDAEDEKDRRR
jgi:50S ribosomal protein L16 3-hydroxylase